MYRLFVHMCCVCVSEFLLVLPLHQGLNSKYILVKSVLSRSLFPDISSTAKRYSPTAARAGLYTVSSNSFLALCWCNHHLSPDPPAVRCLITISSLVLSVEMQGRIQQ